MFLIKMASDRAMVAPPRQRLASQKGVGMIEVLVAMVLLAIGVIGYAALQVKATAATSEGLIRTQAITFLRETSEKMLTNGVEVATVKEYRDKFLLPPTSLPSPDCVTAACSAIQAADVDVYNTVQAAKTYGLKVGMYNCPGNFTGLTRSCLIAAWGATTATFGDTATDCMTSDGKSYNPKASCIVMEAY